MQSITPVHTFSLESPEDTARLGKALAQAVQEANPGALLLYGDLGAGKTTLSRTLVESLPGGENAEVASPSFTICNIYCTAPEVHHFDLYRLEPGMPDEALGESLDCGTVFSIVEWSERLAAQDFPVDGVTCRLHMRDNGTSRYAEIAALGPAGERCLALFLTAMAVLQGTNTDKV